MYKALPLLFAFAVLNIPLPSIASDRVYQEQTWGIGAFIRNAEIPFDTKADNVTSFLPMMFYVRMAPPWVS